MVLTVVHNTQNYGVFGLCPPHGILEAGLECFRFVSAVFLGSESRGSRDHSLLSQI
jgi:hypothetical protein